MRKLFATNLDNAGYIVVEVGVFPASGSEVDLSPADFTLRVDPNAIAERPADADVIAAIVTKGDQPRPSTRQPGYGSIGGAIGIGTGNGGIDSGNGTPHHWHCHGWYRCWYRYRCELPHHRL